MTVNARSTMLCYKHAANQMIAQGRGGRIIGTEIFVSFSSACIDLKIFRGMFGSGQKRLSRMMTICNDIAHIVGVGAGIAAAYCASKFAIRGLTQAAGMPFPGFSVFSWI
jgi:NAD(P)-dependent dehydrogenase (short-subunit alcohol dehydrogenase family)